MVLFSLEKALGDLIKKLEFISNSGENFPDMEGLSNRTKKIESLVQFSERNTRVETAYINELFSMLISAMLEERPRVYVKYLKALFEAGDVFAIRNALAHPNRPFLPCYWYRVAAICSDPIIDSLGLKEVTRALISAEENTLVDPPEDWVNKYLWVLPNNLPSRFDHEVTGLIGRGKELDRLIELLKKPRLKVIAIMAPGGFGKTALALEALQDSINKPETLAWAESIIFITLKAQKLSSTGLLPLQNAGTINELTIEIINALNELYEEEITDLDEAFTIHGEKRILLFIDNLETLIRDDMLAFDLFNQSLPDMWRLLITSRINVSFAQAFPLDPLRKPPAMSLARSYLAATGHINNRFSDELFETIVTKCEFNPLAIRLTLDRYKIDPDIKESIEHTKKNILDFSYTNLIDRLRPTSASMLEALYLMQPLSRREFCEILDMTLDEASEAIQELKQTSLFVTHANENEEVYELSPSVREFLITNSKNVNVRARIRKTLDKQKQENEQIKKRQKNAGITEWHQFYLSPELPNNLICLLERAVKLIIRRATKIEDYQVILRNLIDVRELYDGHPIYHRILSIIYEKVHDLDQAESELKQAFRLNENDHVTRLALAEFFFGKRKNFLQAIELTEAMIKNGFDDPDLCDNEFSSKLVQLYLQSLLYNGKFSVIFSYTLKWEYSQRNPDIKGVIRAAAYRKSIEDNVDREPQNAIEPLDKALKTIENVFRLYGFSGFSSAFALKIYDEVIRFLSGHNRNVLSHTKIREWLNALDNSWYEAVMSRKRDNEYVVDKISKLRAVEIGDNPFREPKWKYIFAQIEGKKAIELAQASATLVKANITFKKDRGYAFATNTSGQEFFLHVSKVAESEHALWDDLNVGDTVQISIPEGAIGANSDTCKERVEAERIYLS